MYLTGCSTAKKAFSSKKNSGSDEFLVKKKSPLVMPPNYNDLPVPEIKKEQSKKNKKDIQTLISGSKSTNAENKETSSLNTSIEDLILKEINKN